MNKNAVACLLLSVPSINANAQVDYGPQVSGTGRLGSVYFSTGSSSGGGSSLFLADFRALAPGSSILATDLSGYRTYGYYGFDSDGGSALFTASLGLHPFATDERQGPELRIGLQAHSRAERYLELERREQFRYDTLVSASTGALLYLDSTVTDRIAMSYVTQRIGVEASLIFRTIGPSRWTLFAGGGMAVGGSLDAYVQVSRTVSRSDLYSSGWTNNQGLIGNGVEEVYRNVGLYYVNLFIPAGASFRLGRKSRSDLFVELRPGTITQRIKGLDARSSFALSSLFGWRVRLGA